MGLDRRYYSKPLIHLLATVELSQYLGTLILSLPQRLHFQRVSCAALFLLALYEQIQGCSSMDDVALVLSVLPNPVERLVLDEPRPKASYGAGLPWIWLKFAFCRTELVSCIGISSPNMFGVSIMMDCNEIASQTFACFSVIEMESSLIELIDILRIQEFSSKYYVESLTFHYPELPLVHVRTVGGVPTNRYCPCGAETFASNIGVGFFSNS